MPAPTLLERLTSKTVTREDVARALRFTRRSAVLEMQLLTVVIKLVEHGLLAPTPLESLPPRPPRPPSPGPTVADGDDGRGGGDGARPSVGSVRISLRDAKRRLVSIDGAEPFAMPARQAALLAELVRDEGFEEDGVARFRKTADIAAVWGCSAGSVRMAILRLRRCLRRDGCVSPGLVETRRHEVRLRLRKHAQVPFGITPGERAGAPFDEG